jgi:hypothetical protein
MNMTALGVVPVLRSRCKPILSLMPLGAMLAFFCQTYSRRLGYALMLLESLTKVHPLSAAVDSEMNVGKVANIIAAIIKTIKAAPFILYIFLFPLCP